MVSKARRVRFDGGFTVNDDLSEQCEEFIEENPSFFNEQGLNEEEREEFFKLLVSVRADGIREGGALMREWFDGSSPYDVEEAIDRIDELADSVEEEI